MVHTVVFADNPLNTGGDELLRQWVADSCHMLVPTNFGPELTVPCLRLADIPVIDPALSLLQERFVLQGLRLLERLCEICPGSCPDIGFCSDAGRWIGHLLSIQRFRLLQFHRSEPVLISGAGSDSGPSNWAPTSVRCLVLGST